MVKTYFIITDEEMGSEKTNPIIITDEEMDRTDEKIKKIKLEIEKFLLISL